MEQIIFNRDIAKSEGFMAKEADCRKSLRWRTRAGFIRCRPNDVASRSQFPRGCCHCCDVYRRRKADQAMSGCDGFRFSFAVCAALPR